VARDGWTSRQMGATLNADSYRGPHNKRLLSKTTQY